MSNNKGLLLELRITPGSSKNRILGRYGEKQIKVAIQSPPVDGKANEALVKFIAEAFSVSQKNVELISGGSSRSKKIFISGNPQELQSHLDLLLSRT